MIEERAIVTKNMGDIAQVRTERKKACGACSAQAACGVSVLAKLFANRKHGYSVLNPIGARIGEQVVIGIPEAALTSLSFLFYIVPLLTMMLFAGMVQWLSLLIFNTDWEPFIIFGGLLGLIMGLALIRLLTDHVSRSKGYQAVILRRCVIKMSVEPMPE